MNRTRVIALALAAAATFFLGACAETKPWQKEFLADPAMQVDADPMISPADDHIYFSREASKGGRGFGGGGCGCN